MAVRDDKPLSVKALLTAGADPNSRNADGERVLSVATRRQETEIEALLKRVRD
jgi:ankyrin repeat protein